GVDNRRNPRVGCANQRHAFLDRAQPRLGKMLVRPGRRSEPAVVGYVKKHLRTLLRRPGVDGLSREYRLITNQWRGARHAGNRQRPRSGPGCEATRNMDKLSQAQAVKKGLKG